MPKKTYRVFVPGASGGDVVFDCPQDEYLIISLDMLYYLLSDGTVIPIDNIAGISGELFAGEF